MCIQYTHFILNSKGLTSKVSRANEETPSTPYYSTFNATFIIIIVELHGRQPSYQQRCCEMLFLIAFSKIPHCSHP